MEAVSHHLELSCMLMMLLVDLLRNMYKFTGIQFQCLLDMMNDFWCSDRLLLTDNALIVADHVPRDFRLVNVFIADLLGALLHSNFTHNSC
jgi:hypothetical protein